MCPIEMGMGIERHSPVKRLIHELIGNLLNDNIASKRRRSRKWVK